MKILFLALEPPFPANDGGRIRTFNLLRQIARQHSVVFVTSADIQTYPQSQQVLEQYCQEIHSCPPPPLERRSRAAKLKDIKKRYPVALRNYASETLRATLKGLIEKYDFDIAHVDQIYLAQYYYLLNGIPSVLTHHNIEALLQRRELWRRQDRFRVWWWLCWLEYMRWKRFEVEVSREFDSLVVVSDLEAGYFKNKTRDVPIIVVPNGVDSDHFSPQNKEPGEANLLFTGRLNYAPNIEGAVWFCNEILPFIRHLYPHLTLKIVGRDPVPEILALGKLPDVTIVGTVPDMLPYYADASVYVVPLKQGGGTRLKILEAMAMGMPVVSTRIGCEGLNLHPGEDIEIADGPEEFTQQVSQLIDSRERRNRLGTQARQIVVQKYDWRSIVCEQEKAYQAAIERHQKIFSR